MSKPVHALITLIASIYLLVIFIPEINDAIVKHSKGPLPSFCVIFTVAGASSVNNSANSGTITATFPTISLPAGYILTQQATGGSIGSGGGWTLSGGGSLEWAAVNSSVANNWADTAAICSSLGSGWRMATQGELSGFANTSSAGSAAQTAGWNILNAVWSSNAAISGSGNYYAVNLSDGLDVFQFGSGALRPASCVR